MHIIRIEEGRGGRYRATLGGDHLTTSRAPLLASARALLAIGFSPDDAIGMTRDGSRIDMQGRLGTLAGLAVQEGNLSGPRLVPYRPWGGTTGPGMDLDPDD